MIDLYIDPGLRACGVAVFVDGKLHAADLVGGDPAGDMRRIGDRAKIIREITLSVVNWMASVAFPSRVFIELPQVYKRGTQRASKAGTDPNDLIHLAAVVGALSASLKSGAGTRLALPAEWKSQMPKLIMHERAHKALTVEEAAKLPILPKSTFHNVMDAVCMGLVDHGRLKTAGVL